MNGASMLRSLPQLDRLLHQPGGQALLARYPRPAVVEALRGVLAGARTALLAGAGAAPDGAALLAQAAAQLAVAAAPHLRRVINATGIMLHTNLGRAPLAAAAAAAAAQACGYCNLEFDLESGDRGSRMDGIEPLLRQLTGAEAGLAVNNNAAAMLLALSALAGGGEVIVSRGELVEIGGGFRIPDVIQQGGARLIEVGTTNKTRLEDYRRAITPATKVLLKVHQSNFRLSGFTEAAPLPGLAALAAEAGLLLVHDLGSGAVRDLRGFGLAEATVQESVEAGVSLVAFSGDKLLGGPQAGLLVGRRDAVAPLRRHPLLRALRLDKLVLAALEATLRLHCQGALDEIPVLRMAGQAPATLRDRAGRLAALLGPAARAEATVGYAGGGTLPESGIPSAGVSFDAWDPEALRTALRQGAPPVVARVADGRVLLDMLAVDDADVPEIARAVKEALQA